MMLWLTIILFILQPVFIGFVAQRARQRTGAIWFAIAFALNIAFALFLDSAQKADPEFYTAEYQALHARPAYELAFGLMVFGPSTLILLIAIFSLPQRKPELQEKALDHVISSEAKTCPDCAEQVRLEARKCRYCGHIFAAPAT